MIAASVTPTPILTFASVKSVESDSGEAQNVALMISGVVGEFETVGTDVSLAFQLIWIIGTNREVKVVGAVVVVAAVQVPGIGMVVVDPMDEPSQTPKIILPADMSETQVCTFPTSTSVYKHW